MNIINKIKNELEKNKKLMILIRGIPGSGKSTLAKEISDVCLTWIELNGGFRSCYPRHYEADMFYYKKYGKYNWNKEECKVAHEWCKKMVECDMLVNDPIVVSNTFIKKWEIDPYIELCKKYDYNYIVIRMYSEYKNVHDVPEQTIKTMKENIEHIPGEWAEE